MSGLHCYWQLLKLAVLSNLAHSGIVVEAQEAHGHGTSEPTGDNDKALVWDFNHLVSHLVHTECTTQRATCCYTKVGFMVMHELR